MTHGGPAPAKLGALLKAAGYEEAAICRKLGVDALWEFRTLYQGRAGHPPADAVDALIHLFLDQESLDGGMVSKLLDPELAAALHSEKLLVALDGGQLAGVVMIYPVDGLYIVSDRGWAPGATDERKPATADVVYSAITPNTARFLRMIPATPCERYLDLCAGSGVAALRAARAGGHAWACDITRRSTDFAAYNAALNGLTNVTALEGDLYEPVAGLTFDRIVAHPPYIPALETEYIFRDGGPDGEQITRAVIAGLPQALEPGGRAYITAMATDRKGAPLEKRLREWLGEREREFDVLVCEMTTASPSEHFMKEALAGTRPFEAGQKMAAAFLEMAVERIVYASMVFWRHGEARRSFTARRRSSLEAPAEGVEGLLQWEARQLAPDALDQVLEAKPSIPAAVRMQLTYARQGGPWAPAECVLRVGGAFPAEATAAPWVAAMVMLCDGQRSTRQIRQELIAHGAIQDAPEHEFARFIQSLAASGLLGI